MMFGACAILVVAGCTTRSPEQQRTSGLALYAAYCEYCHDAEEGIGPRLTPNVLATRLTAAQLFIYNKEKMPYNAGGILTDAQYWDITAFLLARSALMNDDIFLDRRNAEGVILTTRNSSD